MRAWEIPASSTGTLKAIMQNSSAIALRTRSMPQYSNHGSSRKTAIEARRMTDLERFDDKMN